MCNELTTTLIGVGSTIAGTVLGWILNNLSNRGKLSIFVSSWEDNFEHKNLIGEMVPCTKRDDVESYFYKVSFELYNSSGSTKIMRNIQIVFSDGRKDVKKQTPMDDATKKHSSPMVFYDKVGPVNVPPKAVIKLNLHDGIWNQDGKLDFIWKSKKVYLIYTNEKNKVRKILIKTEDFANYFNNHTWENSDNG